jgi:hypothetical protein
MSTITMDSESWVGSILTDSENHKLGTIEDIYFDEQSRPLWRVVKTGRFGARHSLVPLADARRTGHAIATPFAKRQVEDAPRIDLAEDLRDEQVRELYRYYGLTYDAEVAGSEPEAAFETAAERVLKYLM